MSKLPFANPFNKTWYQGSTQYCVQSWTFEHRPHWKAFILRLNSLCTKCNTAAELLLDVEHEKFPKDMGEEIGKMNQFISAHEDENHSFRVEFGAGL